MAIAVVHRLETIEIEKYQRCRTAIAPHIRQGAFQRLYEAPPVEQSGKGILVYARLQYQEPGPRLGELVLQFLDFLGEPCRGRARLQSGLRIRSGWRLLAQSIV